MRIHISSTYFFAFWGWMFGISSVAAQPCGGSASPKIFPKKSFEIVSVLVDACDGSNEGQNEMIRLITGSKAILPSAFSVPNYKSGYVNWGNNSSNPWRGVADITNSTRNKLNYLNSTIKAKGNCGWLIGLSSFENIPPFSQVLFITSESFSQYAQDFSDLNDTLYVIFQESGNSAGHFVNYGTSSTRTFILRNSGSADTVVYDRNDLINLKGQKGSDDGAVANFEFNGQVSYANYGCRIPIPVISVDAGKVAPTFCDQQYIQLNGVVEGTDCFKWKAVPSDVGYFSDSTIERPKYYPKKGFQGMVKFYLIAYSGCSGHKDSVEVAFKTNSNIQITIDSSNKPVYCFQFNGIQTESFRTTLINIQNGRMLLDTSLQTSNWCYFLRDTGLLRMCFKEETLVPGCGDTMCFDLFKPFIPQPNNKKELALSNVFTPGKKDGYNDEFVVVVGDYIQFKIEIYNRWGAKVFESNNPNISWNGQIQNRGENCPQGTYFYLLKIQLPGEQEKEINGTVMLLD